MMEEVQSAYQELYVYTMGRKNFILQHAVDAHKAQTATPKSKPIGVVFSLIGLYLHTEKGYTGTQVQQVHLKLGQVKRQWPSIDLPTNRGEITPADVMAVAVGPGRDAAIDRWCECVWKAYSDSRGVIVQLLADNGIA